MQGLNFAQKQTQLNMGKRTVSILQVWKKRPEAKIILRLKINNTTNTNQKEILSEIERFYKNLFNKREVGHSANNFFDDTIRKLNSLDKNTCEGF